MMAGNKNSITWMGRASLKQLQIIKTKLMEEYIIPASESLILVAQQALTVPGVIRIWEFLLLMICRKYPMAAGILQRENLPNKLQKTIRCGP